MPRDAPMKWTPLVAFLVLWPASGHARPGVPLYDPVALNIGLSCQWQSRCISKQQRAMKRALKHVRAKGVPSWRIQLCNRNAARSRHRVDWIGFYNCVRNDDLRPPPPRASSRRSRSRTS